MRYLFLFILVYSVQLNAQKKVDIDGNLQVNGTTDTDTLSARIGIFPNSNFLPSSWLELKGSIPALYLYQNQALTGAIQINGNHFYVRNVSNGDLLFWTNNVNRMTIAANGNVGIGTYNPASTFSIIGAENNGTTAGLEINSASQQIIMDGNEIDCTSGSLLLNYNSRNNVLIRTSTSRANITLGHESGSVSTGHGVAITNLGSNSNYWTLYTVNSDGDLQLHYNGTYKGTFSSSSGSYASASDRRLKSNIKPLTHVLDRVKRIQPSLFTFKDDARQKQHMGFIAQDMAELFPEVVNKEHVGDSPKELFTMDYSALGVIALAGLKEMEGNHRNGNLQLQKENQLLKQQVLSLEERVAKLESLLTQ